MLLVLGLVLAQMCDPEGEFVCRSGAQTSSGYKSWSQLGQFFDEYDVGGVGCGVYSPNGVATRNLVAPTDGDGVTIRARKHVDNLAGGVIIEQSRWRGDGGAFLFSLNAPRPCDTQTFGVTENGDVHFGMSVNSDCTPSAAGALRHRNPVAGAPTIVREPGLYLAFRCGLGTPTLALNQDGSHPNCDDGGTRTELVGGQCYWRWAGEHGCSDVGPSVPMPQGFLQEWYNPLHGDRTDHRAFIDMNGGYWQNHQLRRSEFPPAGTKVLTDHGEYYYDAQPGVQMFAVDTQHWYFMKPDAGDFVQYAEQPVIDQLISNIASLEARVTALEALCH